MQLFWTYQVTFIKKSKRNIFWILGLGLYQKSGIPVLSTIQLNTLGRTPRKYEFCNLFTKMFWALDTAESSTKHVFNCSNKNESKILQLIICKIYCIGRTVKKKLKKSFGYKEKQLIRCCHYFTPLQLIGICAINFLRFCVVVTNILFNEICYSKLTMKLKYSRLFWPNNHEFEKLFCF